MSVSLQAAPKSKWDWGFMAKKVRAGGKFYYYFFSDSVCMYVCIYIYWDARPVRPLTFNTHIFCQFYSMQQHADSIIRVNGLVQMEVRDPEVRASNGNERESETTAKFNMHVYIVF